MFSFATFLLKPARLKEAVVSCPKKFLIPSTQLSLSFSEIFRKTPGFVAIRIVFRLEKTNQITGNLNIVSNISQTFSVEHEKLSI